jgi:hypothetical protein
MADLYDPELLRLTDAALDRLRRGLADAAPTLSARAADWMLSLTSGRPAARYFTDPDAFPLLLLPWWLEEQMRGSVDRDFQGDLVYSSISGYYFVRLVDDLMDGRRPEPPQVIPAMLVLHAEFQYAFQSYFPADHAFWSDFFAASYEAAETAAADAAVREIDRAEFLAVSSRKVAGVKVPLAAVCHRYGGVDLMEPWTRLVVVLGRWHQMRNDIFDWRRDLEAGATTYFLSEAARRVGAGGSIHGWVLGEGLAWGMAELELWMDELLTVADAELESAPLVAYLRQRRRRLDEQWHGLRESLAAVGHLSARLSASQRSASAIDQPLRRP